MRHSAEADFPAAEINFRAATLTRSDLPPRILKAALERSAFSKLRSQETLEMLSAQAEGTYQRAIAAIEASRLKL